MMKLLVKFLLPLFFLLLGGYAHTCQSRISHLPNSIFDFITPAADAAIQSEIVETCSAPPSNAGKVNDKIKATEIEDDDDVESFKKNIGTGSCCCITFFTQVAGCVYDYCTSRLPQCEHFSYFSSYKFIIHRVLRI